MLMTARVLVPVTPFDPWTRSIARTVASIESADSVLAELIYIFEEGEQKTTVANLDVEGCVDIDLLAARKSGPTTATEILGDAGFTCEISGIESAESGQAILHHIDETDTDRVYMYGRKRSPVGKAVFGSDLQEVLFNASVPVIVLPADAVEPQSNQTMSDD